MTFEETPGNDISPETKKALDEGWELMKLLTAPQIFYWKADDGWEGCWHINATPGPEPSSVYVRGHRHDAAGLTDSGSVN